MKLSSCIKDETTFKCDSLETTISRIAKAFEKLGLEINYHGFQFSKKINLYWGKISIPSLNISSNGKGLTPELAKASAFAELVERISSGIHFRRDSINEFDSSNLAKKFIAICHFDYLDGYIHSHQDALPNPLTIEQLVTNKPAFSKVDLDQIKQDNFCKHWVNGYSVISEKEIKVPLEFIWGISRTNGLASGNTLEEAVVQASNEIFERYVCIKVIQDKKILPTIAIESIENNRIRKIITQLQKKKIEVLIKDFSYNKLFPCIGIFFINNKLKKSDNLHRKAFQYKTIRVGSSFSTNEALIRCLTEQMQGKRLIKGFGKKGSHIYHWDTFLRFFEPNLEPILSYMNLFRRYEFSGDLSFLEKGPVMNYNPDEPVYDCLLELKKIKAICQRLKTDFIVINHTHPILDFPVVRVVIPGLSDLIPYFDLSVKANSSTSTLLAFLKNSNRFIIENKEYYNQSSWMKDANHLKKLAKKVIYNVHITKKYEISTISLIDQKINAIKLLASLYYKLGDLKHFAICSRQLAVLYPEKKRQCIFWHLLAKYNQKELLADQKEKLSDFGFYFLSEPMRNPFVNLCDEISSESFEANYLKDIEKLIDSFYINRKEKKSNER